MIKEKGTSWVLVAGVGYAYAFVASGWTIANRYLFYVKEIMMSVSSCWGKWFVGRNEWLFKSQERNWRTHYNFICEPGREETVGGALIGIGASQKISFVQVEEQFKGLITFDAIGAIHTLPDVSLMRPFQPPAPFGGLNLTQLNFCNKSDFQIYNFQNAPEIPREWFSKWISRNDVKNWF